MISRHRLRGRGRFIAVRSGGVRGSAGVVRVAVAPNGGEHARIGFALPGMRTAVLRNRLRRRLRDAVRPLLQQLAGRDVVVMAGADASRVTSTVLAADVNAATLRALHRSGGSLAPRTADNGQMTPQVQR